MTTLPLPHAAPAAAPSLAEMQSPAPPQVGRSNESTRLAWVQRQLKRLPAGSRLLDAGAGEQRFRPFCAHLKYVAHDFAQYDGRGDGSGLQSAQWDQSKQKLDLVSDIASIPAPNGSFDAVLCTEVFEHVPDPLAALREFARLLRPGGTLLLTAPFNSLTHMAPYHFASGFNRYFYSTHLPAHGFEVTEIQPNGNFFEYLAQELRRLRGVATRYANDALDESEQESVQALLGALQRLSAKDTGSRELLCFGYHVQARKVGGGDAGKAPRPEPGKQDAKPQAAGLAEQSWLSSLNHALRATARRQPPPSPDQERKSA